MSVVLTAYLLRTRVRGVALADPTGAIDPEREAESVALRADLPFEARLFVPPSSTGPPDWQSFLEQGSSAPLGLQDGATNGAALLVRVTSAEEDRWVAFTFGSGRFLLKRDLSAITEIRGFRSPKFAVTERGAPALQSYRSPPFEAGPKRCWAA